MLRYRESGVAAVDLHPDAGGEEVGLAAGRVEQTEPQLNLDRTELWLVHRACTGLVGGAATAARRSQSEIITDQKKKPTTFI